MADRPILFSGPMVRALLDGSKTQTRRIMSVQPDEHATVTVEHYHPTVIDRHGDEQPGAEIFGAWWADGEHGLRCPYGQPGDRLRVKEAAWMWCERRPNGKTKTGRDKWIYVPMREAPIHYAADHPSKPAVSVVSPDTGNAWGWRLKIGRFLPAWASRITLEITAVRVERLQDISEADAVAEGCEATPFPGPWWQGYKADDEGELHHQQVVGEAPPDWMIEPKRMKPMRHLDRSARDDFRQLWLQINGPGSWDANPWVWIVDFRRVTP